MATGLDTDPSQEDDNDLCPSPTAENLISNNLLDEISKCSDEDEFTPPTGGLGTPSEPEPGHIGPWGWGWKTDVPDFVPQLSTAATSSTESPALGPSIWSVPSIWGAAETDAPEIEAATQFCGQFDWPLQVQQQEEELTMLQHTLERMEQEKASMQLKWENDRKALTGEIGRYRALLSKYSIPLEEVKEVPRSMATNTFGCNPQAMFDHDDFESSSLDAKLRRLDGLLAEGNNRPLMLEPSGARDQWAAVNGVAAEGGSGISSNGVASTLQAMFPHATVRTGRDKDDEVEVDSGAGGSAEDCMADKEVRRLVSELQSTTRSDIDDRAMMSLKKLSVPSALEALYKIEEVVQAQGGSCRNLSSILQSVCRKVETARLAAERWKAKEDEKPKEKEKKISSDSESGGSDRTAYWTLARMEQTAQEGFELGKEGQDRWKLRLNMAGLDSSLPDSAVQHLCDWLRKKLAEFKASHGIMPLRKCQGEIDLGSNGLTDQALAKLLDCLASFDVHAARLKLGKNKISALGIQALCEFIRNNKRAGQIFEIHLSHNEVDGEAAMKLLRTLKEQRNRYPPKREVEGMEGLHLVPVWLRLDQNRIRDPASLLTAARAEGISHCAARSGSGCGPWKCTQCDCPLVHLHFFTDQAPPDGSESAEAPDQKKRNRKNRKRASGDDQDEVY